MKIKNHVEIELTPTEAAVILIEWVKRNHHLTTGTALFVIDDDPNHDDTLPGRTKKVLTKVVLTSTEGSE